MFYGYISKTITPIDFYVLYKMFCFYLCCSFLPLRRPSDAVLPLLKSEFLGHLGTLSFFFLMQLCFLQLQKEFQKVSSSEVHADHICENTKGRKFCLINCSIG